MGIIKLIKLKLQMKFAVIAALFATANAAEIEAGKECDWKKGDKCVAKSCCAQMTGMDAKAVLDKMPKEAQEAAKKEMDAAFKKTVDESAAGKGACMPADKTEFDMGQFEEKAKGVKATYKCGGAAAGGAGGDKAADEKACDALKDASDEAKTACKTWAGKKCADEKDEKKKEECTAAKASATTLAASAVALFAVASLM